MYFSSSKDGQASTVIIPMVADKLEHWQADQPQRVKNWLKTRDFKAKPGCICLVPSDNGELDFVMLGLASEEDFWSFGALPAQLPEGVYKIQAEVSARQYKQYLLGWALGHYQFTRYQSEPTPYPVSVLVPDDFDTAELTPMIESVYWVRDLINTPADDLGPTEYSRIIADFASSLGASFSEIVGEQLLTENYPLIHAVGRASDDAPRLVELRWGKPEHPTVALVGKGVCFDTGGLNIKVGKGMRGMKKDMGGSAHVLGLAKMIMHAGLPIQLRVLIPLVENSISGGGYRPDDIFKSRKGLSVEVGNTDAEGRLVLADALSAATEQSPALIIDFATLTGAARVALGTDLPGFFTDDETLATDLIATGKTVHDPVWRLPLYQPYHALLKSHIADICNISDSVYGGAITAGLFLQRFVAEDIPWVHFDIMAANVRDLPGRPKGGEAVGMRAVFHYLQKQFGSPEIQIESS